jgi:uncharacterized protein (DUF1330 family)
MAVYMIADLNVINRQRYETYRNLVREAIEEHGGRHLVRGGNCTVLEGIWDPARMVIIEFPSRAHAEAFYHSETYTKARAIRNNAAMLNMILVDGVSEVSDKSVADTWRLTANPLTPVTHSPVGNNAVEGDPIGALPVPPKPWEPPRAPSEKAPAASRASTPKPAKLGA